MSQRRQRNMNRENEAKGLSPARVAAGAGLALGATFAVAVARAGGRLHGHQPSARRPGQHPRRHRAGQRRRLAPTRILFQAGLTGTINLNDDPVYGDTDALYINDRPRASSGPGRDVLAISANAETRVFYVSTDGRSRIDVRIDGLQLRQGNPKYGDGPPFGGNISRRGHESHDHQLRGTDRRCGRSGGGIFSNGNLTIRNSTISGNQASFGGGGIAFARLRGRGSGDHQRLDDQQQRRRQPGGLLLLPGRLPRKRRPEVRRRRDLRVRRR